jgi:integral membrane sensor domain MASE1
MKTVDVPHGAIRGLLTPAIAVRECLTALGTANAIAVAYFLAARLGLALLHAPSASSVFWPASGIAAGIAIVRGRRAFPVLVIGVLAGTIAAGLMSDRRLVTALFNGFWNAGEAVLAAWLLERWFGQSFTFSNFKAPDIAHVHAWNHGVFLAPGLGKGADQYLSGFFGRQGASF